MTDPGKLSSKPKANVTSKYWYNKWIDVGAGTAYRKEPRYSTGWTGVIDFHGYWKYCANSKNITDYPLSEATASSYRIIRIG